MKQVQSDSLHVRCARLVAIAGVALCAATSVHADEIGFNPNGTGAAGAIPGHGGIDAMGSGFVLLMPNPADPINYQFVETGAYELTQPDGVSALGQQDITLTYSVHGSVNVMTGMASFEGGTVNLYADAHFNFGAVSPGSSVVYGANDGTLIGSFGVGSGGGMANGTVTLQADSLAGSLATGYYSSTSGGDMALQQLRLSVQIGNAVNPAPSSAIVSEIVCKAASFPSPGCYGGSYANGAAWFVVTDHAMASISAVPEPSSGALALAGLGMLGAVARRVKRRPAP